MLQAAEAFLQTLHVRWLVIPSITELVGMWTAKFGCLVLTPGECNALDDRVVTCDPDCCQMLKLYVHRQVERGAEGSCSVTVL